MKTDATDFPNSKHCIDSSDFDTPMERQCHHCDCKGFYKWSWRHPLLLHWVLNPGLAINELCLGQRVPSSLYICKCCGLYSQFIECETCKRFHSARIWNHCKFGNWFGLVCPDCSASIPCIRNLTSRSLMILISPALLALRPDFEEKWRKWSRRRVVSSRKIYYTGNVRPAIERGPISAVGWVPVWGWYFLGETST